MAWGEERREWDGKWDFFFKENWMLICDLFTTGMKVVFFLVIVYQIHRIYVFIVTPSPHFSI